MGGAGSISPHRSIANPASKSGTSLRDDRKCWKPTASGADPSCSSARLQDQIDLGPGNQIGVIVEGERNAQCLRALFGRFPPARADSAYLVIGKRFERRDMSRERPTPVWAGANNAHADFGGVSLHVMLLLLLLRTPVAPSTRIAGMDIAKFYLGLNAGNLFGALIKYG